MKLLERAGVYPDVSHADYHADPAPEPSLSASVAHKLLTQSAAHACHSHPRLNPDWQRTGGTRQMNDGSIMHDLILGGGADIVVIDARDFKTAAARLAKEEAIEAGKVPVLAGHFKELKALAAKVERDLAEHRMFRGVWDKPDLREATFLWQCGSTWCRARPDLTFLSVGVIGDFKFTASSAAAWPLGIAQRGDDLRAALYLAGYGALCEPAAGVTAADLENAAAHQAALRKWEFDAPGWSVAERPGRSAAPAVPMRYLFVVVETEPPHGIMVYELDTRTLAIGATKYEKAAWLWRTCMQENSWPSYPQLVCQVGLPVWAIQEHENQEWNEAA